MKVKIESSEIIYDKLNLIKLLKSMIQHDINSRMV